MQVSLETFSCTQPTRNILQWCDVMLQCNHFWSRGFVEIHRLTMRLTEFEFLASVKNSRYDFNNGWISDFLNNYKVFDFDPLENILSIFIDIIIIYFNWNKLNLFASNTAYSNQPQPLKAVNNIRHFALSLSCSCDNRLPLRCCDDFTFRKPSKCWVSVPPPLRRMDLAIA